MTPTVTLDDLHHHLAMRDRAESAYAETCRTLVASPHDPHILARVQQAALRVGEAQAQYALMLRLFGEPSHA